MNSLPGNNAEPLRLADGTLINPETGRPIRSYFEVPSHSNAVREITAVRRRLTDLPVPPKQLNPVSLVVLYNLIGLDEGDIAVATGLSHEQVLRVQQSDAFRDIQSTVIDSIAKQDADDVRQLFSRYSTNAANRVVELMNEGDDKVALNAAKDVLDRAGHRPADVVEHRMKVEGGLRIEYIKRDENDDIPTIDVTPTDIEELEDV